MSRILCYFCLFVLAGVINSNSIYAQGRPISGIINHYTPVIAIGGCNRIDVESTTDFNVGDRVLIIQMQGASITTTNGPPYGKVVSDSGAGTYEFGRIAQISGTTVILEHGLLFPYLISGNVQLVRVPEYPDAWIIEPLTCPAWNGRVGGVIVFTVDTVWLGAGIDATAKGFRGGTAANQTSFPTYYITDYTGPLNYNLYGMKGEGIAGFGSNGETGGKGPRQMVAVQETIITVEAEGVPVADVEAMEDGATSINVIAVITRRFKGWEDTRFRFTEAEAGCTWEVVVDQVTETIKAQQMALREAESFWWMPERLSEIQGFSRHEEATPYTPDLMVPVVVVRVEALHCRSTTSTPEQLLMSVAEMEAKFWMVLTDMGPAEVEAAEWYCSGACHLPAIHWQSVTEEETME